MAKNNNKKQSQPSFFEQQLQRNGPGWIYAMNTEQIRKNALKVFKDIAFGNVDPNETADYFAIPDFTYNLKMAADDNAMYNYYTFMGLQNCQQAPPELIRVANIHWDNYTAYNVTSQALNNILMSVSAYGPTFVPAMIMQAITMMAPYKHYFSGYFITLPRGDDQRIRVPRREIGGNINYDQSRSTQSQGDFWQRED